ncbi:MAG: hypothetical protein JWO46_1450, partial [Nocardioidaceae bacterium]|nr:hypothetical protein [Nocardioidaceae bacterium]
MKYVILIHSNPQPWGHPTSDYLEAHRQLPEETRQRLNDQFESLLAEMTESGELLGGQALGDPTTARLFTWNDGEALATDGPYSETKEHLAGFFLVDVADRVRADQIGTAFAGPDETVEVR